MKQRINNISKIYVVDPLVASRAFLHSSDTVIFGADISSATELQISGLGSCEVSSYTEDRELLYNIKLTAALSEQPGDIHRKSYIFETVTGAKYIFGSGARPYPQPTTTEIFPSSTSEKSVINLSVEYTSIFGLYLLK